MGELPKYSNPITTSENINELHHLLVQTCLDYMRKHNLTDIDEINFSAYKKPFSSTSLLASVSIVSCPTSKTLKFYFAVFFFKF